MGKKFLSTEEWSIYRSITDNGGLTANQKELLVRDLAVKFGLSPVMMRVRDEFVPYDYNAFIDAVDNGEGGCEPYFSPSDAERVTGSAAGNWVAWSRVATGCGNDSHPDLLSMVAPASVKETLKQRGYPYRGNIRFLSIQTLCFYLLAQRAWDKNDMDQIVRIVRMKNLITDHLRAKKVTPLPAYLPPGISLQEILDGPEATTADLDAEIQAVVGKPEKETTTVRVEAKPRPVAPAPTPNPMPDFMGEVKKKAMEEAAAQGLFNMVSTMGDEDLDGLVEMLIAEKNRRLVRNASSATIKDGELDFDKGIMHWIKLVYPDGQTARYLREDHVIRAEAGHMERWVDPAAHLLDSLTD